MAYEAQANLDIHCCQWSVSGQTLPSFRSGSQTSAPAHERKRVAASSVDIGQHRQGIALAEFEGQPLAGIAVGDAVEQRQPTLLDRHAQATQDGLRRAPLGNIDLRHLVPASRWQVIREMSKQFDGNLQPASPRITRERGPDNSKNSLPWNQERNFRLVNRGVRRLISRTDRELARREGGVMPRIAENGWSISLNLDLAKIQSRLSCRPLVQNRSSFRCGDRVRD